MALCSCETPTHTYRPEWCRGEPVAPAGSGGTIIPMRPTTPWGRENLRRPEYVQRKIRAAFDEHFQSVMPWDDPPNYQSFQAGWLAKERRD